VRPRDKGNWEVALCSGALHLKVPTAVVCVFSRRTGGLSIMLPSPQAWEAGDSAFPGVGPPARLNLLWHRGKGKVYPAAVPTSHPECRKGKQILSALAGKSQHGAACEPLRCAVFMLSSPHLAKGLPAPGCQHCQ
jgi:hypothetical protein